MRQTYVINDIVAECVEDLKYVFQQLTIESWEIAHLVCQSIFFNNPTNVFDWFWHKLETDISNDISKCEEMEYDSIMGKWFITNIERIKGVYYTALNLMKNHYLITLRETALTTPTSAIYAVYSDEQSKRVYITVEKPYDNMYLPTINYTNQRQCKALGAEY